MQIDRNFDMAIPSSGKDYDKPRAADFRDAGREVTDQLAQLQKQAQPWVRLTSVLFLLKSLFWIVASLMIALAGIAVQDFSQILVSAIYFSVACLLFFPGVFLWILAGNMAKFSKDRTSSSLIQTAVAQRNLWRAFGIAGISVTIGMLFFLAWMVLTINSAFSGPI